MNSSPVFNVIAFIMILCCACACPRKEVPLALPPHRSESELISELDAVQFGDDNIVILPVDLWAKDSTITMVIAVGSKSEEAATKAAVEYAKHITSDTETLVLENGNQITLVPMQPPGKNAPMVHFAPPTARTVLGTKSGRVWAIVTPTVLTLEPVMAGKYRVTLSPRDIKLAAPSLDPLAIRFEPKSELEARANPN